MEHNPEWVLWNALQKGEMYSELSLDLSVYLFIGILSLSSLL